MFLCSLSSCDFFFGGNPCNSPDVVSTIVGLAKYSTRGDYMVYRDSASGSSEKTLCETSVLSRKQPPMTSGSCYEYRGRLITYKGFPLPGSDLEIKAMDSKIIISSKLPVGSITPVQGPVKVECALSARDTLVLESVSLPEYYIGALPVLTYKPEMVIQGTKYSFVHIITCNDARVGRFQIMLAEDVGIVAFRLYNEISKKWVCKELVEFK